MNTTQKKKLSSELRTIFIRCFGLGLNYAKKSDRLLLEDLDWLYEHFNKDAERFFKLLDKLI